MLQYNILITIYIYHTRNKHNKLTVSNKLLNTNKMAGTKTNYFNVLKLRGCAKPARLHCKQAKEYLMIFIFLTDFPADVLEDATNYSWIESVHTKLPLKSP